MEVISGVVNLIEKNGLTSVLTMVALASLYIGVWSIKKLLKHCDKERVRAITERDEYKVKYDLSQQELKQQMSLTIEREKQQQDMLTIMISNIKNG